MQPFVNVFLGILQNFLKLSKKLYLQGAASGVNIWIITHFHCQNLTNYNWNQCHFHHQNQCPTTPGRFGLSLSMTAVF